jgi:hypothetical protein
MDADTLFRWIETNLWSTDDSEYWSDVNFTYPDFQVVDAVVDKMAQDYFGGYGRWKRFTIDRTRYKCKVLRPQNKAQRSRRAYDPGKCERLANVIAYRNNGRSGAVFNMHILLRRVAAQMKIDKRERNRIAAASGGWQEA